MSEALEEISETLTIKSQEKNFVEQISEVEGLDVQTGLTYCVNDPDFYKEMLQEYLSSDKQAKLEQFFAHEDWENYRIIVHALKSTSLTIGATHLSEQAKALEQAAKSGDVPYLHMHHQTVMDEYADLTDRLTRLFDLF